MNNQTVFFRWLPLLYLLLVSVALWLLSPFSPVAFAGYCAVIAYVYSAILIQPGMIFAAFPAIIYYLTVKWSKGNINKQLRYAWFLKSLTGCETCLAGQLSLLLFPLFVRPYGVWNHLFAVSLAILLANSFARVWKNQ